MGRSLRFRIQSAHRHTLGLTVTTLLAMVMLLVATVSSREAAAHTLIVTDTLAQAASDVIVENQPNTPWVKVGETVTYAIHATSEGSGTAAVEITLDYGKDLELVEVKPGPFLGTQTIPGPKVVDNHKRRATFVWARVGPTPAFATPDVLAYVTFKALPGRPWNTWIRQRIGLVSADLRRSQQLESSLQIHVYDRLPVPVGILPARTDSEGMAEAGTHPVFEMRTHSPASFKYKIEVSQNNFGSILHTFDQNASQEGWSQSQYLGSTVGKFTSPELLQPGKYQWRAYAWIEEINQWTGPSLTNEFAVSDKPMGLTRVSPVAVDTFQDTNARVVVDGWGFTPGTRAVLAIPGLRNYPLTIEPHSDASVTVIIPSDIEPGLAELNLRRSDGEIVNRPLVVMPSSLFVAETHLPLTSQIVPGREFTVQVTASNVGTTVEHIALVRVDLPDLSVFQLLDIAVDAQVEILDKGPETILLAMPDNAKVGFKLNLPTEVVDSHNVSVGSYLSLDLRPTVLGEVSLEKWEDLRSQPTSQFVQVVQAETEQRLSRIALTFNHAPPSLLEDLQPVLLSNPQSAPIVDLIGRLEGNSLDIGPVYSDIFPDFKNDLQIVTSNDSNGLLFDPPGFSSAAYISEIQEVSYAIRFENPGPEPAGDITVTVQLGPGIDMASVRLGKVSHPNRVSVEMSDANGTITWSFKDIWLPQNQQLPAGESWVRFSARPHPEAVSGTSIVARAAVQFDFEEPLETKEVTHTIDSEAPETEIEPMTSVQLSTSFAITRSGGDDAGGSGLKDVTLLVSENGGALEAFGALSDEAFQFQGETGKTYGFATVSTDHVGHTEPFPNRPDVTVTVGHLLSLEPGWHLVGIPLESSKALQEGLSRLVSRWSAWDSLRQTYLPVGLEPASTFPLVGAGLWANFDEKVSYYVTGQPIPVDQPYSIELQTGWNLIASPFPLPVRWDLEAIRIGAEGQEQPLRDAQAQGWVEDFAWGWNGDSYSLVYDSRFIVGAPAELEPFKGYWFQSHRAATLILPPPEMGGPTGE